LISVKAVTWLIFGELPPLVLFNLLDFDSFVWVYNEDFLDEIFDFFGDSSDWAIATRDNFFIKFGRFRLHERKGATNHGIQDDSATPNVDKLWIVGRFTLNHLRRGVTGRSACRIKSLA
jgi:hypothetical protein